MYRPRFSDRSRRCLKSTTFGANLRSEYEYNGLNWRTVARFDAQLDEDLDQERVMYYDQSWRLLEERIDDDLDTDPGFDRALQYVWGNRYIDDIAFRRANSNFGNDDPAITYEASWYYATDALFSVVAIIRGRGALTERVQYDAYGAARHQRQGDVDGDGDTDGADNAAYLATAILVASRIQNNAPAIETYFNQLD